MKKENFNLIIVGVGGQGQLTLLNILQEAALNENLEIKTSELHGLSQRGGAVEVQARFGKNIFSPLVCQGDGDLILALEMQEALRGLYYASEKTEYLVNDLIIPIAGEIPLKKEEILEKIQTFTKKIRILEASKICKEKFGNEILGGIFMLGYGVKNKLLPLKKESMVKAIKKVIPKKHLSLNLEAFNLPFQS